MDEVQVYEGDGVPRADGIIHQITIHHASSIQLMADIRHFRVTILYLPGTTLDLFQMNADWFDGHTGDHIVVNVEGIRGTGSFSSYNGVLNSIGAIKDLSQDYYEITLHMSTTGASEP